MTEPSSSCAEENPERTDLQEQILDISGRGISQPKLVNFLTRRFGIDVDGKPNSRVELRLNKYTLFVPERLTETEIDVFIVPLGRAARAARGF